MPIKLVLADRCPLVLEGLDSLFRAQRGMQVLARCMDGQEALRAVRAHRPHVLILDPLLDGGIDGLDILQGIRGEELPTRVVLLATVLTDDKVVKALRLGVRGIVLKEMGTGSVLQCVRAVSVGQRWMDRQAFSQAMDRMLDREIGLRDVTAVLTRREFEILRLVSRGRHNKEIAKELSIDEGTVKSHLHHIYEKLHLDGRVQLALYAREHGVD